jgi:hypothetical protein
LLKLSFIYLPSFEFSLSLLVSPSSSSIKVDVVAKPSAVALSDRRKAKIASGGVP